MPHVCKFIKCNNLCIVASFNKFPFKKRHTVWQSMHNEISIEPLLKEAYEMSNECSSVCEKKRNNNETPIYNLNF